MALKEPTTRQLIYWEKLNQKLGAWGNTTLPITRQEAFLQIQEMINTIDLEIQLNDDDRPY